MQRGWWIEDFWFGERNRIGVGGKMKDSAGSIEFLFHSVKFEQEKRKKNGKSMTAWKIDEFPDCKIWSIQSCTPLFESSDQILNLLTPDYWF